MALFKQFSLLFRISDFHETHKSKLVFYYSVFIILITDTYVQDVNSTIRKMQILHFKRGEYVMSSWIPSYITFLLETHASWEALHFFGMTSR